MKLVILGLAALLLLGCAQNAQSAPPAPEPSATPPPSAPPGTPPAQQPPTAPPATPPAQPPPAGSEYAGMTLEAVAATGDPVECDITFTYQNAPAQAKFYMAGTEKMRYEETSSGIGQCKPAKTITVIRDTRRYVGCEGKTVFPGCYWFRSDHSGGLPEQFRNLPASGVTCRAWVYDETKFQTPGQSCSM